MRICELIWSELEHMIQIRIAMRKIRHLMMLGETS